MPAFLSRLPRARGQARNRKSENYDESGVWIGQGFPDWAVAPDPNGGPYDMVETVLTGPVTGQTYLLLTRGGRLRRKRSKQEPGGDILAVGQG